MRKMKTKMRMTMTHTHINIEVKLEEKHEGNKGSWAIVFNYG